MFLAKIAKKSQPRPISTSFSLSCFTAVDKKSDGRVVIAFFIGQGSP
jgi:hypothetical protein